MALASFRGVKLPATLQKKINEVDPSDRRMRMGYMWTSQRNNDPKYIKRPKMYKLYLTSGKFIVMNDRDVCHSKSISDHILGGEN
uniref:Uncharacterized protein n=1 Tax=Echeneis naucrates TaxID=173247 RepID=A0A665V791_ECHNA